MVQIVKNRTDCFWKGTHPHHTQLQQYITGMDITRIFDGKWKYLAAYLSFKLSVRDKTPNWWIFPNTNLEHKYFEKLKKFCYLAKLWVFRSFTPWWKMIFGVSNLPKFRTFFIHYYHKMFHLSISGMGSTHNSLPYLLFLSTKHTERASPASRWASF